MIDDLPGLADIFPALEPDSGAVRTARYDVARRKRGQVRVSLWVPADRAAELRAIAAAMVLGNS